MSCDSGDEKPVAIAIVGNQLSVVVKSPVLSAAYLIRDVEVIVAAGEVAILYAVEGFARCRFRHLGGD